MTERREEEQNKGLKDPLAGWQLNRLQKNFIVSLLYEETGEEGEELTLFYDKAKGTVGPVNSA
ncbi:hypothetical protein [Erwinia sp. E_sp_B04_7]|uniref:hypothetical protein n=1 Tax=unclassified Erwinia TaxID=2622719 RepID=UPI0030D49F65